MILQQTFKLCQVEIDMNNVGIGVRFTERDKDNVHWLKRGKEPSARKMECTTFTSQLYNTWGWRKDLAYRSVGRIVSSDKKIMLLYDFVDPETWQFKDKSREG